MCRQLSDTASAMFLERGFGGTLAALRAGIADPARTPALDWGQIAG
jgi:hypothetical protein